MWGDIPLAPFPTSNLVKVHLGKSPPVSLVPPVSLLVGFPEHGFFPKKAEHVKSGNALHAILEPARSFSCLRVSEEKMPAKGSRHWFELR